MNLGEILWPLLGGTGILIMAMAMMTDGAQTAGGDRLRVILGKWTANLPKGIASGFLFTGLVQSSSAVTVAAIGFVNAGLLKFKNAIGIVYGSNVGATVAGWLVAATGFGFSISDYSLPMIGIGVILQFVKGNHRISGLGVSLAGFGLFFLGIDILKGGLGVLANDFSLKDFGTNGFLGMLSLVIISTLVTAMIQSSTAAMAIILGSVASGMIGLEQGCAMVIGANIGTTSTGLISSVGTTVAARQLAWVHVIFNVWVGIILLPTLMITPDILRMVISSEGEAGIQASLALYNTFFNVFGLIAIAPISNKLSAFLQQKIERQTSDGIRPKYLDDGLTDTPDLGLAALQKEMERIARRVGFALQAVVDEERPPEERSAEIKQMHKQVASLLKSARKFLASMQKSGLTEKQSKYQADIMFVAHRLWGAMSVAKQVGVIGGSVGLLRKEPMADYAEEILKDMADVLPRMVYMRRSKLKSLRLHFEAEWNRLISLGYTQIEAEMMRKEDVITELMYLEELRKMVSSYVRALRKLSKISADLDLSDELKEAAEDVEDAEEYSEGDLAPQKTYVAAE